MKHFDSFWASNWHETLFLVFWGCVAVLVSLLLYFSNYSLPFARDQVVIGSIEHLEARVRIKGQSSLNWSFAGVGESIRDLDQIFTHRGSSARVQLENQGVVEIYESSLVRLQQQGDKAGLVVDSGLVSARLVTGSNIVLFSGGKMYELQSENAEVQVLQGEDSLSIQIISGAAQLTSEDKTYDLDQSNETRLGDQAVKSVELFSVDLLAPKHSAVLYTEGRRSVFFQWEGSDEVRLHIGHTSNLDQPLISKSIRGGQAQVDLAPGQYYWTLASRDDQLRGVLRSFTIREEQRPKWVQPQRLRSVFYFNDEDLLGFELPLRWDGDADLYELHIEHRNGDREELYFHEVITSDSYEFSPSGPGEFTIQVRPSGPGRESALWSERISIIIKSDRPPRPRGFFPKDRSRLLVFEGLPTQEVQWRGESSFRNFILEWIDPLGNTFAEEVAGTSFSLGIHEPGEYRWRVQAIGAHSRSEFTEYYSFLIQREDFAPSSPEDGRRITLNRPHQQVRFEWARASGVREYIFELAEDERFEKILHTQKGRRPRADVELSELGHFYWRTKVVTSDGQVYYSTPYRVIIQPNPPPERPEVRGRLHIEYLRSELLESVRSWMTRVADLFFAQAVAEDEVYSLTVQLTWPRASAETVNSYRIRISNEQGEHLLERDLDEPLFIWEKVRPGNYNWEVAYIDHWNQIGPFSEPEPFTVTGPIVVEEEQLEQVEVDTKVTLLSPQHGQLVQRGERITFSWLVEPRERELVDQLLLIAKDLQMEEVIETFSVRSNLSQLRWTIPDLDSGIYYWRVQGRAGAETPASLRRRFEVSGPIDHSVDPLAPEPEVSRTLLGLYYQGGSYHLKHQEGPPFEVKGESLVGARLNALHGRFYGEFQNNGGKVFDGQDFRRTSLLLNYRYLSHLSGWHLGPALFTFLSSQYSSPDQTLIEEESKLDAGLGVLAGHQSEAFDFSVSALYGTGLWLSVEGAAHFRWFSLGAGLETAKLTQERQFTGLKLFFGKRFEL